MDEKGGILPDQEIDLCTLGMVIIDEIHYLPPTPSVFEILGGAGTWSALGARLFSPLPESKRVGWVVDKGYDFPPDVSVTINSWNTSTYTRVDLSRQTTRGWNGYDSLGKRAFKYATPKLRIDHTSLAECPPLLASKSFHLACSANSCISIVMSIMKLRQNFGVPLPKPRFIWEPIPDLMVPDELLNITRALGFVDICSPNHSELGQLMGCSAELPNGDLDAIFIEDAAEQLLASMPLSTVAVVVRCGKTGCYIAQNGGRTVVSRKKQKGKKPVSKQKKIRGGNMGLTSDTDMMSLFAGILDNQDSDSDVDSDYESQEPDWGISSWIPAYHQDASKVVDPTGGGNGFLGALSIALARGKKLEEAATWGTIAASFAIEQVGMPLLGTDEQGRETWNGVRVADRLCDFETRWGMQSLGIK